MSSAGRQLTSGQRAATWGLFIGDALSMPVHWYYNTDNIKEDFGGWLTKYEAPKMRHPSSLLGRSAAGGAGRGGQTTLPVIGDVILHDKLQYWQPNPDGHLIHYHQGMKAGDNTLNALCALKVSQSLHANTGRVSDRELRGLVLKDYIQFMTTPQTHNDTYAESFHRLFFKDWRSFDVAPNTVDEILTFAEKRYVKQAGASDSKQLAVIGSLVMVIPWVVYGAGRPIDECLQSALEFVRLTHPVKSLEPYVEQYVRMLHAVLNGSDLKSEILNVVDKNAFSEAKRDELKYYIEESQKYRDSDADAVLEFYQNAVSALGTACYIDGSLASVLLLAYGLANNFDKGMLMNVNVGGENCHRGAALGALLGAAAANRGEPINPKWTDGLHTVKVNLMSLLSTN